MKKPLFLILIFLVSLSDAEPKTLAYDSWISNAKGFSLDSKEYIVLVTDEGSSILLKAGTVTKSIELHDCVDLDNNEFCLNESAYITDDEDYKVHLYVYNLEPSYNLILETSADSVLPGDEITFTATIENDGDLEIPVTFENELPKELEIQSIRNGLIRQNAAYWQGTIKKGETREIEYIVEAAGELDSQIKSKLSYFDGYNDLEIFSDAQRVYTVPVLSYELISNKDTYEVGEEARFTLAMQNKGESSITVDRMTFAYSGIANIKEGSSTKNYNDEFSWTGVLEEGEYKNITFTLVPGAKETYLVSLSGTYIFGGRQYGIKGLTKDFETENLGVLVNVTLSKTTVKSGEPLTIVVKATNRNSFQNITKARLIVKTDIANFENTSYGTIATNKTALLLNNEIIAPNLEADRTYSLTFNVTYYMQNGEVYSEEVQKSVEIIADRLLLLEPSLGTESINDEDSFSVSLSIRNPGNEEIKNAEIKAIIPAGLSIKGPSSGYLTLAAGEDVEALTFTLFPEMVMGEEVYLLNFTAKYEKEGKGYLISAEKKVLVSPKKPVISISRTLKESEIHQGQALDNSYTISNGDSVPVYNLYVVSSKSQEFDNIEGKNISLPKLDPGESSVLKAEQLRTKRQGVFGTGSSILFFKDRFGRTFNVSSTSLELTVSESAINGPAAYLSQYIGPDSFFVGEEIIILINITNIGKADLEATLDGFGPFILKSGSVKSLQKNVKAAKEGVYSVEPLALTYAVSNDRYIAYSNQESYSIANRSEAAGSGELEVANEKNKVEESPPEIKEVNPKKSFFARFFEWFTGLFK